MKYLLLITCLALAGCADDGRVQNQGQIGYYKVECIDGVQYLRSKYALSVKFNPDSTVAVCKQ